MDSKSIVDYLFALYDKLTWQRLGQVAIVLLFTAAGIIFWKNVDYISGAIRPSKIAPADAPLVVSDSGKTAIEEALRKAGGTVNAISVVSMNLQRNSRRVIFFTTNDPEIRRQNENFIATHASEDIPVFTDNMLNNKRIINYINGEFQCVDWKEAQASKYLIGVDVKAVCGMPVPPIYGQFRGTVIAFVKVVPDADEQLRLKSLLRDLSDKLDNPSDKVNPPPPGK